MLDLAEWTRNDILERLRFYLDLLHLGNWRVRVEFCPSKDIKDGIAEVEVSPAHPTAVIKVAWPPPTDQYLPDVDTLVLHELLHVALHEVQQPWQRAGLFAGDGAALQLARDLSQTAEEHLIERLTRAFVPYVAAQPARTAELRIYASTVEAKECTGG